MKFDHQLFSSFLYGNRRAIPRGRGVRPPPTPQRDCHRSAAAPQKPPSVGDAASLTVSATAAPLNE